MAYEISTSQLFIKITCQISTLKKGCGHILEIEHMGSILKHVCN